MNWGIEVDNKGYAYVADNRNSRIQKFTDRGIFVTKWGTYGTADNQFLYAGAIAIDNTGYILAGSLRDDLIKVFTLDGRFITKWGGGQEPQMDYSELLTELRLIATGMSM